MKRVSLERDRATGGRAVVDGTGPAVGNQAELDAEFLAAWQVRHKMKGPELATFVGYSAAAISKWRNGRDIIPIAVFRLMQAMDQVRNLKAAIASLQPAEVDANVG